MKILNKLSITKRITLIFAAIFTFTLFLLSAGVLYSVEFYQTLNAHKDIETAKADIISENLDKKEIYDSIELFAHKNIYFQISSSKKVIYDSPGFKYSFDEKIPYDMIISTERNHNHVLYEKTKFFYENNEYELMIVKDLYNEKFFLKILFAILAVIDTLGIVVSLLAGYLFSKKVLKPIDIITKTAKTITPKNLSARIPLPQSRDELYELSKTLNIMADNLQSSFNKQAQFVSDASHELRTPIAAIKGHSDLILRWGKNDEAALEKSAQAIKSEAEYMQKLVTKLLYLARLDNKNAVEKEQFNLSQLIIEILEELCIYHDNYDLSYDCDDDIFVFSDKGMVKQLILILTDNAFKFTKPQGKIKTSCKKDTDTILITIADTGCGINEDEIPHIFDRFYTNDKARNRNISGNGLGLSIAKEICNMLNINISVKSKVNEGTSFQLFFPLN